MDGWLLVNKMIQTTRMLGGLFLLLGSGSRRKPEDPGPGHGEIWLGEEKRSCDFSWVEKVTGWRVRLSSM